MSQTIPISLRKLLGERSYFRYLEETVIPEIKQLHETGEIKGQEFRKINDQIQTHGLSVLAPDVRVLDCASLNTASPEGSLLKATLQLTPTVSIHHIIKSFSGAEDFDAAVYNQQQVVSALRGTSYEYQVPQPNYVNRRQRVMVTPFVEGNTLSRLLQTQDPTQQEETLQKVIDDYIDFSRALNERKEQIHFQTQLMDYNTYFQKVYLRKRKNSKLEEAFAENIGNHLNQSGNSICHGDLHKGNIIVNGSISYIDWPKAARNGCPELDIATLIRKSPSDLETRLIEYATQQLYPDYEAQRKNSSELIEKNLIKQDLVYAQRYLEIAEKTKDKTKQQQLYRLSQVLFNTAIRRIKSAESRGFVNSNLLEAILEQPPETSHFRVLELKDDEYESMKQESDPYSSMTQEQLQATPQSPITSREGFSESDRLDKLVRKNKRDRKLGQAGLVLCSLTLIGGLGYGINQYGNYQRESTRAELSQQDNENSTLRLYEAIFRDAFEKYKTAIIDGKIKQRLPLDSKEIDKIAKQFGLDQGLLKEIMRVNRYYAGMAWSLRPDQQKTLDLNLLDPIAIWDYKEETIDPLRNLKEGAYRLSQLVQETHSDIGEAVYRFYSPIRESNCYPIQKDCLKWRYGDTAGFEMQVIRAKQAELAYNALNGLSSSYDGGMWSVYLGRPREVDPPKGTSKEDCQQKCDDSYQGQLFANNSGKFCVDRCIPVLPQSQEEKDCLAKCSQQPYLGLLGGICEQQCLHFN